MRSVCNILFDTRTGVGTVVSGSPLATQDRRYSHIIPWVVGIVPPQSSSVHLLNVLVEKRKEEVSWYTTTSSEHLETS